MRTTHAIPASSAQAQVWRLALVLVGIVAVGAVVGIGLDATGLSFMFFAALAGLAAASLVVGGASRIRRSYLIALGVILAGYAVFGRPFSYIGFPPLFVGEIAFVVGLLVIIGDGDWKRVLRSPVVWAIACFGVWGAIRTIPFVATYDLDALRDAVIWGYGAFAVIVAACLRRQDVDTAVRWYDRFLPMLLVLVPALFAVDYAFGELAPIIPWTTGVALIEFKPGNAAVHVGAAAAFLLLGLGVSRRSRTVGIVLWCAWFAAAGVTMSLSRGGMLSIMAAFFAVAVLGPATAKRQLVQVGGTALVVGFITLFLPPIAGDESGFGVRPISSRTLLANLVSLSGDAGESNFGGAAYGNLDETRDWRSEWWRDIVGYTVGGQFFWGGKGFGINLADDDGYQVEYDVALRSPHSVHMTVLARAGVPGMVFWLFVNLGFALFMLKGSWEARRAGQDRWWRLSTWVLAVWLAIMINASFDVYLEGPSGGIWFWALIGFGIAIVDIARREREAHAVTSGPIGVPRREASTY
jgi:hypothetical protein